MNKYFAPALAIAVGLLVLLGYFLPIPILQSMRFLMVNWMVILAAVAVLVGVLNLLTVHFKRLLKKGKKGKESVYSLFLIAALLFTLVIGIIQGPEHPMMLAAFKGIILPVERSLFAIMAVTLIYAGIRLLRHHQDLMAIIFLVTAIIVMLGTAPLFFYQIPLAGDFLRPAILRIFATSGARGLLLGIALGTLLTGLRTLIGVDRPYGGNR